MNCKIEIIKKYKKGDSQAGMGRELGFGESIIRYVLSKADEYRDLRQYESAAQCMRNRRPIMVEMGDLLTIWVRDCN